MRAPDGVVVDRGAGEHLDVDAVVVVAAPTTGRLERPPSRQHCPGGQQLLDDRKAGRAGPDARAADSAADLLVAVEQPRVQLLAAGAESVPGAVIGAGDEA